MTENSEQTPVENLSKASTTPSKRSKLTTKGTVAWIIGGVAGTYYGGMFLIPFFAIAIVVWVTRKIVHDPKRIYFIPAFSVLLYVAVTQTAVTIVVGDISGYLWVDGALIFITGIGLIGYMLKPSSVYLLLLGVAQSLRIVFGGLWALGSLMQESGLIVVEAGGHEVSVKSITFNILVNAVGLMFIIHAHQKLKNHRPEVEGLQDQTPITT